MDIPWLVTGFAALLLAVIWLLGSRSRDNKKLRDNKSQLELLHTEVEQLKKNLAIFNDGAVGIGRRLVEAERHLNAISSDQAELKRQAVDVSYTQANELIEAGASVEDLVRKCGLPRAEAELMLLIHRQLHEADKTG